MVVVAFAAICLYVTVAVAVSNICTVEPRYNEGLRGLAKFVRFKEVSFYRVSFSFILLLLG